MCELRTIGLLSLLALVTPACVLHDPGLLVEVRLDMQIPATLDEPSLTLVELVPCPGTAIPTHTHDGESAPLSMSLDASESVWLTPRVGRYCDLRLQLEARNVATRQAVVPLVCTGERAELTLDETSVESPIALVLRDASIADEADPPQRALERLLRSLEADACTHASP